MTVPPLRVGVDLIEIERVRRALERHPGGFRERCFTEAEQAYCDAKPNPAQHYAGRFAAKEAIGKALGDRKGIRRYGHAYVPLDEALSRVVIDFSGRPGLEYHVKYSRALVGDFDVDLTMESYARRAACLLKVGTLDDALFKRSNGFALA